MTVTVNVELIKEMEEQIQMIQSKLSKLTFQSEGFEVLDSDPCLLEVYNS